MDTPIVTRAEWGAEHGTGSLDPGPEPRVVIHHSYRPALKPDATPAEERAAWRGIERYHVESNGWAGIGYNFGVAPSGRIYEGRGWKYRGAHAGPMNGSSIGICLLIDGSVQEPPEAAIGAVRELIALGLQLGEIAEGYEVSGHRDHMPRTCPGEKVYARLQEFRHDAAPSEVVIPPVEPDIVERDRPRPTAPPLDLERIEAPTPAHVEEIARVRRLSPEQIGAGIVVAEVLLRGVLGGKEAGLKAAADALSDWIRARRP